MNVEAFPTKTKAPPLMDEAFVAALAFAFATNGSVCPIAGG
jgi:hypothetical protein